MQRQYQFIYIPKHCPTVRLSGWPSAGAHPIIISDVYEALFVNFRHAFTSPLQTQVLRLFGFHTVSARRQSLRR